MNVDFRQLRAFAAIGRLSSFTRAAAALHTTQPALSAQIRRLEEALEVRLFDRNTRAVTLTQTGHELLPAVERVLGDLQTLVAHARDVAHVSTGRVTLAALPSVSSTFLPRAISELRASHPGITIVLKDALADRIAEMVRGGVVDFGVTGEPVSDGQLEFMQLASDRMVVVMQRGHALSRTRAVRLDDLRGVPLVLMDRESSVRHIVDRAYAAAGLAASSPAYEAAFMATAIAMVRSGLGVTLLPSSAVELASARDLTTRTVGDPRLTRKLGILRNRRRSLSPAAQLVVDLLRQRVPAWFAAEAKVAPASNRRHARLRRR